MGPQNEDTTAEYWRLPGIDFPDNDNPMAHNMKIRSLLLQTHFCRAGNAAPRLDRFKINLRVIFKGLMFFYDYIYLGEHFWSEFARRLCPFWDGALVEATVHLYSSARKRYLEKHAHTGQIPVSVAAIIQSIDAYHRRLSRALPAHSQATATPKHTFEEKLEIWDPSLYMWPSKSSVSRNTNLSIKGLSSRSDWQPPQRHSDLSRPDEPPRGPTASKEKFSKPLGDTSSNRGASLASRITAPPKTGCIPAVNSNNEGHSPSNDTQQSPRSTLKRGASFSTESGSSKRPARNLESSIVPTTKPRTQKEIRPGEPSPVCSPDHPPDQTKEVNATIPDNTIRNNEKPEDKKKPKHTDTAENKDKPKENKKPEDREKSDNPKPQVELKPSSPVEPVKQPELERIDKTEAQLKAIKELLEKRFGGIEEQVVAVQQQISQSASFHMDTIPKGHLPENLPLTHYLEDYLKTRNYEVLLEGVGDEVRKIKKYLLHGLKDHEHNQTSDAWKRMEGVWLALDEADRRVNGS